ncbi:hypothetical protein SLA2020_481610 [Shorea laevis]
MALPVPTLESRNDGGGGGGEAIEGIDSFPRFDVVSDDSDHHFLTTNKNAGCFTNASSGVHKKIMHEWRILDKHLPESIFVRVFERRIDLLRAVIIGAAGTPYHDGLFFFDIAFPPDYPSRPPMVHYRSFGYRINPNLYANGKVCLSLINTWVGKKTEKWNPKESTVLQLLLSIQGLVLNEKPYFNEPGNVAWPGRFWEKKSAAYNEDAFLLSCRTMMLLIKRPPKNFEGFVMKYFRDRSNFILSACKAYKNGSAKIGYYNRQCESSPCASEKFKKLMKQLYPELVVTFSRTGASLGNFVEQVNVGKKTVAPASESQARPKHKVGGVLGKLLKFLGLKKMVP